MCDKELLILQVDNALTAAHNVLFSKGLDTAVATSRQQHAANVEAAHEAREAYLKKACFWSWSPSEQPFSYPMIEVTELCNEERSF